MSAGKLGYLLKKFPRLSETFVLGEILGQERLGREIHVFSRRPADDEPRHPALSELRATVETLPPRSGLDPWKTLFSDVDDPQAVFARIGRVVQESRGWDHARFSGLLSEALHLLCRTRELGIGHLHVHFATDSAIVAMLINALGGPSYSITAHAKDIYRSTVASELLEQLFLRASFVVTVCDANVAYLKQRLSQEAIERVRRLYNGIDRSAFPSSPHERENDRVLAVGRLVEKKGFDVLIRAAHVLTSRGRDLRVTIAGAGDQEAALRSLVDELDLGQEVELAGPLDQAEVGQLMRRATVLCAPCKIGADGNRDALPTVLLEALACGLPSVSTPVTGIPEILDHGRAGVLVPEHDVVATADALEALLDDAPRRAQLARIGVERARRLFDLETNARVLHAWLEAALNEEAQACALPA